MIDCKTPQAELTNLYPYCDYEMRVCAYNALGDGHYSKVIHCQTLEDGMSNPTAAVKLGSGCGCHAFLTGPSDVWSRKN